MKERITDERALCPECGRVYPFRLMVELAHCASRQTPCCDREPIRTGQEAPFTFDTNDGRATEETAE